ncbi:hypothetical protein BO85DRAFT_220656 [Aspergillus piperis CBS 112811]|uniref:Uncharacterized protein n=1 Tax=Aspergillus piperis CBS 112811 TaxID=1448313 RepID=A0A8G1R7Y2_9EURO|nr:hypothetical protein BO85DRAFT_220656 [Aspergillus piperis CBS 112811]RAH60147.1 hypothetical protein BO85DRAFT_220656 [Aspergillus piperis CBS 112811]
MISTIPLPSDYRNAEKWRQYDPTSKWIIGKYGVSLGLLMTLRHFAANEIQNCRPATTAKAS